MAEMNKVGILLTLFIVLVVGISILSVVSNSENEATVLQRTPNETLTVTNITTTARTAQDNASGLYYFANSTVDLSTQIGSGVNLSTNGTLTMDRDVTHINNMTTYYVGYYFQGNNYVVDSSSRTILRLITLFFALGILGVSIWGLNRSGILEMFK